MGIQHVLYGILAGGAFAAIVIALDFVTIATLGAALLWGLMYGIILFLIAAVLWMNIVLNLEADMKMVGMFLFFHLIYGVVLAGWIWYGVLG